ncbi:matrixin family metalloprotease [Ekhidna sp.]|uniref:matrixin family metalloprotease n=1 Tax=Ekhidna sp. TaxID=2608089 RepID=UPI003B505B32
MKYSLLFILAVIVIASCEQSEPAPLEEQQSESFCAAEHDHETTARLHVRTESNACNSYMVNCVIHNITRDNGSGGYSTADINTAKDILRDNFNQWNIDFTFSTEVIKDDLYYYEESFLQWNDIMNNDFNDDTRIDILLFPPLNELTIPGASKWDFGTAISVGGKFESVKAVNTKIMAHEMGHALGLNHLQVCGNIMQSSIRSLSCLDYFLEAQVDTMKWYMDYEPKLANAIEVTPDPSCCEYSHWKLTGLPGSNVSNGDTVKYKIKEVTSNKDYINANTAKIRVTANNWPINVVYEGQSYGVQANQYRDFTIPVNSGCEENPIETVPLTFYRLQMPGYQNLSVTVKLQSVSSGHTRNATTHSFTML